MLSHSNFHWYKIQGTLEWFNVLSMLQEHLDAWAPTIFLLILLVSALASYPYPDLTLVILVILAFPFALYLSLQQSQYIWPDPFADEAYPCSVPPPDWSCGQSPCPYRPDGNLWYDARRIPFALFPFLISDSVRSRTCDLYLAPQLHDRAPARFTSYSDLWLTFLSARSGLTRVSPRTCLPFMVIPFTVYFSW